MTLSSGVSESYFDILARMRFSIFGAVSMTLDSWSEILKVDNDEIERMNDNSKKGNWRHYHQRQSQSVENIVITLKLTMLNQLTTLSSGLSGCWEWSKRQYQSVDDVIIWGQVENGKMMMFQNTISISWWHYHNIKVENATKTISIRILGVWKLMMMLQKDNLNHYHLGCLVQKNLHCTVLGQTGHKTNPNNTRLFFPF